MGTDDRTVADVTAEQHDTASFVELGQVPKLRPYVGELWARREFAVFVPYHDLRVQKMNTLLGQLWHFLNPALMFFVYYVVFGLILEVDRGIDNYIGYLVIGILLYTTMSRTMGDGLRTIEINAGLIRSVDFPRALLPISAVVSQTMAFLPGLVVLCGTLVITGETPTVRWLLFIVPMTSFVLISVGLALLLARLGFAVRDAQQALEHVFRLLFYGSGVLFPVETFIKNETLVRLFALNPLFDVIALARWALLDEPITSDIAIMAGIYSVVLPIVGLIVFMRAEHKYVA